MKQKVLTEMEKIQAQIDDINTALNDAIHPDDIAHWNKALEYWENEKKKQEKAKAIVDEGIAYVNAQEWIKTLKYGVVSAFVGEDAYVHYDETKKKCIEYSNTDVTAHIKVMAEEIASLPKDELVSVLESIWRHIER